MSIVIKEDREKAIESIVSDFIKSHSLIEIDGEEVFNFGYDENNQKYITKSKSWEIRYFYEILSTALGYDFEIADAVDAKLKEYYGIS